jgi:hypothetical protein
VGYPAFGYLAQHIDQSLLGEYNVLVNTFANRITDSAREKTLRAMVIPFVTD